MKQFVILTILLFSVSLVCTSCLDSSDNKKSSGNNRGNGSNPTAPQSNDLVGCWRQISLEVQDKNGQWVSVDSQQSSLHKIVAVISISDPDWWDFSCDGSAWSTSGNWTLNDRTLTLCLKDDNCASAQCQISADKMTLTFNSSITTLCQEFPSTVPSCRITLDKQAVDCLNQISTSPPVISVHPVGTTVKEGENATFTVSATGDNLQYLWYKNGKEIPGADKSCCHAGCRDARH